GLAGLEADRWEDRSLPGSGSVGPIVLRRRRSVRRGREAVLRSAAYQESLLDHLVGGKAAPDLDSRGGSPAVLRAVRRRPAGPAALRRTPARTRHLENSRYLLLLSRRSRRARRRRPAHRRRRRRALLA